MKNGNTLFDHDGEPYLVYHKDGTIDEFNSKNRN